MIPTGARLLQVDLDTAPYPSRTYRWDRERQRIIGHVDGLQAVQQAVGKILETERFRYPIYSSGYGSEVATLLGRDTVYVQAEIGRIITEALMQDDRVLRVENIKSVANGDRIYTTFMVVTEDGAFEASQEVSQ